MSVRSTISCLVLVSGFFTAPAAAEPVPFKCVILPGAEVASITVTNTLSSNASCIVNCRFSTSRYNNNPHISCAKPVPAGKEVEMCLLTSHEDKMVKLTDGYAECTK